jgi:hypothetical protein
VNGTVPGNRRMAREAAYTRARRYRLDPLAARPVRWLGGHRGRDYVRTEQNGKQRWMMSWATCRHTSRPVCLIGMPKLWA